MLCAYDARRAFAGAGAVNGAALLRGGEKQSMNPRVAIFAARRAAANFE
jgi:hypothetical protein